MHGRDLGPYTCVTDVHHNLHVVPITGGAGAVSDSLACLGSLSSNWMALPSLNTEEDMPSPTVTWYAKVGRYTWEVSLLCGKMKTGLGREEVRRKDWKEGGSDLDIN